MATPFKLKSGNASAFKNLGSSPAKGKLPTDPNKNKPKDITPPPPPSQTLDPDYNVPQRDLDGEKIAKKKTEEENRKEQAEIKKLYKKYKESLNPNPEKLAKSPAKQSKGNFNVSGSKASTTPGYNTTKAAKGFGGKGYSNPRPGLHIQDYPKGTEGPHSEMLRKTTKQPSKVSKFVKGVKKVGKKALKVGGRVAGGLGIAQLGYEAYKSGQKHSGGKAVKGQKSFMADAKKNTKSIYKKK